jgi:HB1, ASXL, restriction endonuclease HTH domain
MHLATIKCGDGVQTMNVLQAAKSVLQEAKKPLHYKEITRQMIGRGVVADRGKDARCNC